MKCIICGFKKEYKTLALPAGDKKYWRCPNCGEYPYAICCVLPKTSAEIKSVV